MLSAEIKRKVLSIRIKNGGSALQEVYCPRVIQSKTDATRLLPIERAPKKDILTILAVYIPTAEVGLNFISFSGITLPHKGLGLWVSA